MMIPAQKESIRYSILLIILLTTGAVAVAGIIAFLDNAVPNDMDRHILTAIIWTVTMGFMFIAGAFGLWAMHFAAEAESLRRISLLVDRMNDIRDGVLAINRKHNIIGMNTSAEAFFGNVRGKPVETICPELKKQNMDQFLQTGVTWETECRLEQQGQSQQQTLRFRIQPPLSGISLVLVSDITSVAVARTRQRRTASLQLAGHMAQGIANDFNDLLCGISGHATLLENVKCSPDQKQKSIDAIQHCADRGIRLARQLIQLSNSHSESAGNITLHVKKHITNGVDLLASSIDDKWKIRLVMEDHHPPVNLPPAQLEHIVHSLGLIVTENSTGNSDSIGISLRKPSQQERLNTDTPVSAILEISRLEETATFPPNGITNSLTPENGIISSLVQTLITQAGGKIEAIQDGRRTACFRVHLPEADAATLLAGNTTEEPLAIGLEAYTAGWNVLLGLPLQAQSSIAADLEIKKIHTNIVHDENAFLQALTGNTRFDVIFLHPEILGQHFNAILSILNKVCPESALVLLAPLHDAALPSHIITLPLQSSPDQWIQTMIDARSRKQIAASTQPS